MKSPNTGKEMVLQKEHRSLVFRKEEYNVIYHFLLCEESGEQFTTTELDELNLTQLYNKYREAHQLPFPDEIIDIRQKYNISAAKMADILGFGTNVYRNYEAGEVPSESNARLIQVAADPLQFKELLLKSRLSQETDNSKYLNHLNGLIEKRNVNSLKQNYIEKYLFAEKNPDRYTGYRKLSFEKFVEMVKFYSKILTPWKTYLNKYLFYADFLNYQRTGYSISGVNYRAIDMGPVPNNFNSIYEYIANEGYIEIEQKEFADGMIGEKFIEKMDQLFISEKFSKTELDTLHTVAEKFSKIRPKEIIEISHREDAWIKSFTDGKKLIDYNLAFELKAFAEN